VGALRSPRREHFCLLIAQGNLATPAARKAGFKYPDKVASQMMRQPAVKARIAEMSERVDIEKAKEIVRVNAPTREWVLKELVDQVEHAKLASDRGATLKGLELVGKEIGMFVQRSMAIESPLARLSADKLLALLALVDEAVGSEQVTIPKGNVTAAPLTIEHQPVSSVGSSVGTEEAGGADGQ
jgi:hypothetical protein